MTAQPAYLRSVAMATGVALSCAVGTGLLLALIGSPANFEARRAATEATAQQTSELFETPKIATSSVGPLKCGRPPSAQAQVLREAVKTFAGQSNLNLEFVDSRPEGTVDDKADITPLRLRFSATGSYENATLLLAMIGRQNPQIFVDSLDMTSKVSNVNLVFSGRMFCAV